MLARRARLILTVSQFSQRELRKYLPIRGKRLKIIYNGGDHLEYAIMDKTVLEKYDLLNRRYLLTVFSDSPHKNFNCVAEASGKVRTKGLEFIGVGGSFPRIFNATNMEAMPPNVHLPGYANDRELKALYEHAAAFILPSFYEGFGFPLLEAMQSGYPVICANTSSLPEIAGDAALYFDPRNPDDLAAQIDLLMIDRALREALIARGFDRSGRFRWERSARETLDSLIQASQAGTG
jgi:glycosyltransferase involved in cell wall biosynthesis